MELVPASGADEAIMLIKQAVQLGGLDFVLVHPQFLSDRSQVSAALGVIGVIRIHASLQICVSRACLR